MRNTIKAKEGYKVKKVQNIETGEYKFCVMDGRQKLFIAEKVGFEEYLYNKQNNECFRKCEVFTTVKGNQFIYWMDTETIEDFITKVKEKEDKK